MLLKKYLRALSEDPLPARVKSACLVSPFVDFLALGGAIFFFMVWGMINIHHYFMDSVTWRKENKDVGRYLFQEE